uniref:Utp21 domain-containing protein n=1 Tax=Wuchereria bancrofti TaxID=6293 RepID=A0A1I8EYE5_WUCBA
MLSKKQAHRKVSVRGEERARSKLGVPNGNETENMYLNFVLSVEVGLKSQLSMIRFWSFRSTKLVAEMKVPSPIMRFSMIGNNWLLALGVGSDLGSYYNSLIDVMKCELYCISFCFSLSGEYLATYHHDQKDEVQRSIEEIELPTESASENIQKVKQVESLVTLSGLAPSRWVNLPYLDVIRERNKPIELVRKPKTAHFSYRPYQHLMVSSLKKWALVLITTHCINGETKCPGDRISFRRNSVTALNSFLKMLITVLRNHCDFELVQAYLTAFLKTSWNKLWISCIRDDDLDKTLSKLSDELKKS